MRPMAFAMVWLMASLAATAATTTPVVNSGVINYSNSQLTVTGTGFQGAKAEPIVWLNGVILALNSWSNTQVVTTLPTGMPAGTFHLMLTNTSGGSTDFDLTYGATGPQGPMGPAGAQGATGPTGPRGAAGATGAAGPAGPAGPAGANGANLVFLNAYNPYASYVSNDVVTYNGSSYIATVANGPNPSGPMPDKNPSWSLLAAAGATGAAGPAGVQGPQGLMGAAGPAGASGPQGPAGVPGSVGPAGATGATGSAGPADPAGPAGPQGPAGTGGTLSSTYKVNPDFAELTALSATTPATVATITLANAGTYFVWGEALVIAPDQTDQTGQTFGEMTSAGCSLAGQGVNESSAFSSLIRTYGGSFMVHTVVVAPTAGETVTLNCSYGGLVTANANVVAGAAYQTLSALQVQ